MAAAEKEAAVAAVASTEKEKEAVAGENEEDGSSVGGGGGGGGDANKWAQYLIVHRDITRSQQRLDEIVTVGEVTHEPPLRQEARSVDGGDVDEEPPPRRRDIHGKQLS